MTCARGRVTRVDGVFGYARTHTERTRHPLSAISCALCTVRARSSHDCYDIRVWRTFLNKFSNLCAFCPGGHSRSRPRCRAWASALSAWRTRRRTSSCRAATAAAARPAATPSCARAACAPCARGRAERPCASSWSRASTGVDAPYSLVASPLPPKQAPRWRQRLPLSEETAK